MSALIKLGGSLLSLVYTWAHPEDGDSDHLLVTGPAGDGGLVALWAQRAWLGLAHRPGDGRRAPDHAEGHRRPASVAGEAEAGPYPVMVADLRRAEA